MEHRVTLVGDGIREEAAAKVHQDPEGQSKDFGPWFVRGRIFGRYQDVTLLMF